MTADALCTNCGQVHLTHVNRHALVVDATRARQLLPHFPESTMDRLGVEAFGRLLHAAVLKFHVHAPDLFDLYGPAVLQAASINTECQVHALVESGRLDDVPDVDAALELLRSCVSCREAVMEHFRPSVIVASGESFDWQEFRRTHDYETDAHGIVTRRSS